MNWRSQANCNGVDTSAFFIEGGQHPEEMANQVKAAKAVCAGCVVKSECLEDALSRSERYGVWGGKSERERRAIAKQRKLAKVKYPNPRAEQAIALRRHGFSVSETATELGVDVSTVKRWTTGHHFARVTSPRQPKPYCRHCDLERAASSDGLCKACAVYLRRFGKLPSYGVLVARNRKRDERRTA